jgi:hypothetical protein
MHAPLIEVAIYLYGERLRPEYVSHVLAIQPSTSQKKGGPAWNSGKFIAKIGLWALIAHSDSIVVSDHIDVLLKQIGNPPTPLNEIEGVEEAHLDVFVTLDDKIRAIGVTS